MHIPDRLGKEAVDIILEAIEASGRQSGGTQPQDPYSRIVEKLDEWLDRNFGIPRAADEAETGDGQDVHSKMHDESARWLGSWCSGSRDDSIWEKVAILGRDNGYPRGVCLWTAYGLTYASAARRIADGSVKEAERVVYCYAHSPLLLDRRAFEIKDPWQLLATAFLTYQMCRLLVKQYALTYIVHLKHLAHLKAGVRVSSAARKYAEGWIIRPPAGLTVRIVKGGSVFGPSILGPKQGLYVGQYIPPASGKMSFIGRHVTERQLAYERENLKRLAEGKPEEGWTIVNKGKYDVNAWKQVLAAIDGSAT